MPQADRDQIELLAKTPTRGLGHRHEEATPHNYSRKGKKKKMCANQGESGGISYLSVTNEPDMDNKELLVSRSALQHNLASIRAVSREGRSDQCEQ